MPYVIQLESVPRSAFSGAAPLYRAPWVGDPGRTYRLAAAKRYASRRNAAIGLAHVRRRYGRPFPDARIVEVEQ